MEPQSLVEEMIEWYKKGLERYLSQKSQQLEPYTIEELEERVMASERQIAEGRFQDFDEALDELEAEFAKGVD